MTTEVDRSEFTAVREVALRHLHTTEDEELEALLWQLLESHDGLLARLLSLRLGIVALLEGTQ